MKRFLILLSLIFCNTVCADTINLHWLNEDGTTYQNSTCVIDSDLILPATPPTKYGYTFTGWKLANYIPIEYLESTGTQYIDTGVYGTGDTKIEVSASITSGETNAIFGARLASVSRRIDLIFVESEGKSWWGYGSGSGKSDLSTARRNYLSDKGNFYINGSLVDSIPYTTFTTPTTLKLFCNETAGVRSQFFHGRIYYFQIYNNDTLVRDFIPVLDANGTPCMYDKVEDKFYYNQGTDNFIAGPVL